MESPCVHLGKSMMLMDGPKARANRQHHAENQRVLLENNLNMIGFLIQVGFGKGCMMLSQNSLVGGLEHQFYFPYIGNTHPN